MCHYLNFSIILLFGLVFAIWTLEMKGKYGNHQDAHLGIFLQLQSNGTMQ